MFAIKPIRTRAEEDVEASAFPAPLKLSVLNLNRLMLRHHPSHSPCHPDSRDSAAVNAALNFYRAIVSSFGACRLVLYAFRSAASLIMYDAFAGAHPNATAAPVFQIIAGWVLWANNNECAGRPRPR